MEGVIHAGSEEWGPEALGLLESVHPQIKELVRTEARVRATMKRRGMVMIGDVRGALKDVTAVKESGNFDVGHAVLGTLAWMRKLGYAY